MATRVAFSGARLCFRCVWVVNCVKEAGANRCMQAKRFLDRFHARQREKMEMLLANEHWTQAHVPKECQDLIQELTGQTVDHVDGAGLPHLVINGENIRPVGALLM